MSEALESNTTLTELNLESDYKKKDTVNHPSTNHSFPFLVTSIGNNIGDTGAISLGKSLKSNKTLTELNLTCDNKRKRHTKNPSTNHSFPFHFISTVNKIGDSGASSLSEALKSNTALTTLSLYSVIIKEKNKDIHQQLTLFLFPSHKQTTRLEKQEQHH